MEDATAADIFVSYKRADEPKVAPLVKALEQSGFTVWWDRGLVGGEGWRHQIERALGTVRCCIVVWTKTSAGPAGSFVQDEAARAMARGTLIPILMEETDIPLGFGQIQAFDLTRWNGSADDGDFQKVAATIRARMVSKPVPAPETVRRRWRLPTLVGGIGALVTALALAGNVFALQDALCSIGGTPLSDFCGGIGWGGKPSRTERLAWEKVLGQPGNCGALAEHVRTYPDGPYRELAQSWLDNPQTTEAWTPVTVEVAMTQRRSGEPVATEAIARAQTLERAGLQAEQLCRPVAVSGLYRYRTSRAEPRDWQCSQYDSGRLCGFDGMAVCEFDERVETKRCGAPAATR